MLLELTIRDFAIIDRARITFASGFNVMTGETGAGKSIIIDAVSLLLGGRAQSEFIRHGTKGARVEGLFMLSEVHTALIQPLLLEYGLFNEDEEDDDETMLILTREINLKGRNVCRVNGNIVPLSRLRTIAAPLVDIHGQSHHLSLMNPRKHVDLLDRFASTMPIRTQFAQRVSTLRQIRQEMAKLAANKRELAYRTERLEYVVDEIESADLELDEEEKLNQERRVLANAEKLAKLAQEGYVRLSEGFGDQFPSILVQVAEVIDSLTDLANLDETMGDAQEAIEEAFSLLDDVSRTLDSYRDTVEYNPHRIEEIERRLTLLFNLKHKYGTTIEEILEAQARAQEELDEIAIAKKRYIELQGQQKRLLIQIGHLGHELSAARREAALRMARTVEQELRDLLMQQARFEVQIAWEAGKGGAPVPNAFGLKPKARYLFDHTGLDKIEFMLAPNPGEGFKPLARVASGGEASRIMLAIKTALGMADDTPTLIFDEIDTGVGGRVGNIVGRKLYHLADQRQVLCITHLPQLAAFGDRHFHIRKKIANDRTATQVTIMSEEERVNELAQMMGGGNAALQAAAELCQQAQQLKKDLESVVTTSVVKDETTEVVTTSQ
ncbi:MAG: DNA repair protein RecN [Ardenticatenaceae bacterium]